MAKRKLTVRKIKEVLRLKWSLGLSARQVGASLRIAHSTVGEYIQRAEQAGLDWDQVQTMDEADLQRKLFPPKQPDPKQRPEPDWPQVEKDLQGKGVTRMLLWREYLTERPDGYGYSQFCERYRQWQKAQQKVTMRIPKKAGEEAQVDYAGLTMTVTDPQSGEEREVQIFVGVLGASGLIYAEAHPNQSLPHWIRAHVRMFQYFGGTPRILRPDNLKSGVTKPNFYDPDLNPTYHELAVHYGVAVIPTRVAKPTDKGLGENAVQQVERWIIAPLRKQRFFSLHDLNQAIRQQLTWLNDRPLTNQSLSRRALFENQEKAALQLLPEYAFEYLEIKQAKVHPDYHVTFHKHQYSVPHTYARQKVLIRASERLVEIFLPGAEERIAYHVRRDQPGYSTETDHMPANHRWHLEWSPERFQHWASQIGPQTEQLILDLLASRCHPEQAYRSCLGILQLAKTVSKETMEAVCKLALQNGAVSYRAVNHLLATKKDMLAKGQKPDTFEHEHIRGQSYYS